MKKQIFTLAFALCAAFAYAQTPTPNVFPATGNVGIGITSPTLKLQVVGFSNLEAQFSYTESIASIGKFPSTGLTFQAVGYSVGGPFGFVERAYKLQMYEGATTQTGFIEFSRPATTNTTKAAVSFGYNGIEGMRINQNGKVRIGNGTNDIKTPDGYKLFVEDGILTEKVKVAVKTTANWADYVFAPEYKLMPLSEVAAFTKENNHLPNVPSAKDVVNEGLDVAKMDAKLLEKIEELTLYAIEQNNEAKSLRAALAEQKKEVEMLKAQMELLMQKQ